MGQPSRSTASLSSQLSFVPSHEEASDTELENISTRAIHHPPNRNTAKHRTDHFIQHPRLHLQSVSPGILRFAVRSARQPHIQNAFSKEVTSLRPMRNSGGRLLHILYT